MKINKRLLFVFYLIMVTIASLMPSYDVPEVNVFPNFDKIVHFSMYALFTFLILWAWPEKFKGKKQILPFLIVLAYGFFMEAMQRYTNLGRTFDLRDELANCLGFFPGWLFWRWIKDKANLNSIFLYIPFGKKTVKD